MGERREDPAWFAETEKTVLRLRYYHGPVPKELVVRLMKVDGDFLLRWSKATATMAISVYWRSEVHHVRVERVRDGSAFRVPRVSSAPTLPELMETLLKERKPLNNRQVVLYHPVPRSIWDMPKDNVELADRVGSGAYGVVYKARLHKMPRYPSYQHGAVSILMPEFVAVKMCSKRSSDPDVSSNNPSALFIHEAMYHLKFCHRNVLTALGLVYFDRPLMIVMEFMRNGSLLAYVKKHKNNISKTRMGEFCVGACAGMAYLESQRTVHRDLALRNVLIADNERDVKISDYGLSEHRDNCRHTGDLLPTRYLAPECLPRDPPYTPSFSHKSDMWSYGVFLWELYSWGAEPYGELQLAQVRMQVLRGHRLVAPENMPPLVAGAMRSAFQTSPAHRPAFKTLLTRLSPLAPDLEMRGQTVSIARS